MPRQSKKSSPTNTRARLFTLPELMDAIAEQLSAEGLELPAPSLPTLKNWSRAGLVDQGADIRSQVGVAIERMQARGRYYGAARLRKAAPLGSQAARSTSSSITPDTTDASAAEILALLHRIHDRLISNIGNSSPGKPTPAGPDAAVVQAIERLDSVRAHLMRRHDAEVQLLRQHAGAQPGGGAPGQGGLAAGIDVARLEGRLNRIEFKQDLILEKLNSLGAKGT